MHTMEMVLPTHTKFELENEIEIEGAVGDGQIKLLRLNVNGVSGDDAYDKYGQYMRPTPISSNLDYGPPIAIKYGTGIQTRNTFTTEFINNVGKNTSECQIEFKLECNALLMMGPTYAGLLLT